MRPNHRFDPLWMLLPTFVLLGLFFFYPLFFAAEKSLYAWDLLTAPSYVGAENYVDLLESGEIPHVFVTTLTFSVVVVTCAVSIGLGLALLLDRRGAFYSLVRSCVFSAYVVSWVSVALLWMWVLDGQGIVNHWARAIGLDPPDWLGDPDVALHALSFVTIWKISGYALVLFLAGLQDIPQSLKEAAALDGAGSFTRFSRIVWPLLRPTVAFVTITSLILSFQVFDVVRVMTQGGPVQSTTVFVYAIYEQVFMNLRVGRASALVCVFFVLLLLLTALQLWAFRRQQVEA